MYEPGSALKPFGQPVEELVTRLQPFGSSVSGSGEGTRGDFWGLGGNLGHPKGAWWCCRAGFLPRGGAGGGGALPFRVSPGGGGRGSVLHAHPGQRVPGKGAAAGAAPAWDVVAIVLPTASPPHLPGMSPPSSPTPLGPPPREVPACRVTVSPLLVLPCVCPGSALWGPVRPVQRRLPPFSPLQMRKGPSASSMPFPPSSPLLSCPPDGARHMVTYWGGFGVGGPRPRAGFGAGQGFDTAPLPYRANWTGTAAAPTATTTTPRRARSCLGERRGWGLRCHPALGTWGGH